MSRERISSIIAPAYKLAPFSGAAYFSFFAVESLSDLLLGALFSLVWFTVLYAFTHSWKGVYIEGDSLLVSNYLLKQIRIPAANVAHVEVSDFWNPRRVTVMLKAPSEFGDRIVFVPRLAGFASAEAVERIRRMTSRRADISLAE